MAVIKTGVVLQKRAEPVRHFLTDSYQPGSEWTIYGDLHLVGNCAILYFPKDQVVWAKLDGWIDLDMGYDCWIRFTSPHHTLVIPASRVGLKRKSVYHTDWDLWTRSGGHLEERP